jgi:hypothetical protein
MGGEGAFISFPEIAAIKSESAPAKERFLCFVASSFRSPEQIGNDAMVYLEKKRGIVKARGILFLRFLGGRP